MSDSLKSVCRILLSISVLMWSHQLMGQDLPNPSADMQTMYYSSYIIPLDEDKQSATQTDSNGNEFYGFNLAAYGLAYELLSNGIPVNWAIRSGKAKDGVDFTANVTRIHPTDQYEELGTTNFVSSAFIVNVQDILEIVACNPTGSQFAFDINAIIEDFGHDVQVYRLEEDTDIDIRYNLTYPPTVAVMSDGEYGSSPHSLILNQAFLPHEVLSSSEFFQDYGCYTFISQPHLNSVSNPNYMVNLSNFINGGGNYLAQCESIISFEDLGLFQATSSFEEINPSLSSPLNTVYNYSNNDMPIMQFEGGLPLGIRGSASAYQLNFGSELKPTTYLGVTNEVNQFICTGADINGATPGGSIFYMAGHEYSSDPLFIDADLNPQAFPDLTDSELRQVKQLQRMYLNAIFIPSTVNFACAGGDKCICPNASVYLGCDNSLEDGAYEWSPAEGLSCTDCPNPLASPTETTEYTLSFGTSGSSCTQATVTVYIKEFPTVENEQINCNPDGTYTVSFEVSGGQPPYYIWETADYILEPGSYESAPIANGQSYYFSLSDNVSCGDIIIEGSFTGPTASISGGATVCGEEVEDAEITINLTGQEGLDWEVVYAIDGEAQSAIDIDFDESPYSFEADEPGLYTLVSVSYDDCTTSGSVDGSSALIASSPVYEYDKDTLICENATILINGETLEVGDSEEFELSTVLGCDSIVTINVEGLDTDETEHTLQACQNGSVEFEGETLLPNTTTPFAYLNAEGCDSTVNVTVEVLPAFEATLELEACEDATILFEGEQLAAGSETEFDFVTAEGCDSILTVTVEEVDAYNTEYELFACEGESANYEDDQILAGEEVEYQYTSETACDSFVNVFVTELTVYEETLELTACEGTTAIFEDEELAIGSETPFTYEALNSCDSTVLVSVVSLDTYDLDVEIETCEGTNAIFEGEELAIDTTTPFDYLSVEGCDSIVNVTVVGITAFDVSTEVGTCAGTTIDVNGQTLSIGEEATFDLISLIGCDSTVTVTVTELAVYEDDIELPTCTGTTLNFDGEELAIGSTTTFNYTSVEDCDSTVNVTVLGVDSYEITENIEICQGETTFVDGEELAIGSTTEFEYISSIGCDSTVTVNVIGLAVYDEAVTLSACDGESAEFDGSMIAAGDTEVFSYQTTADCDSIITVTVDLLPVYDLEEAFNVCGDETATFGELTLEAGTVTPFEYQTAAGCDSTITVTVIGHPVYDLAETLQTCTGTTVTFDGQELAIGSVTSFNYTTSENCDSTITVTVEGVNNIAVTQEYEVCQDEVYTFDGTDIGPGESMDFSYVTAIGCDSIVTVNVVGIDLSFDFNTLDLICFGDSNGQIELANISGLNFPFSYSIDGINFQTELIFDDLPDGQYEVTVQDNLGCQVSQIAIVNAPDQITVEAGDNQLIELGDTTSINIASNAIGNIDYQWQPIEGLSCADCPNPTVTIEETTTYVVQVTDEDDCSGADNITITVIPRRENRFVAPNAFSPNADGMNDLFRVLAISDNVQNFEMYVYDRWGNQIFFSNDINQGWDGTNKGEEKEMGVYVWFIQYDTPDTNGNLESKSQKGNVTLIR